jgi:hypothetical protein
MSLPTDRHGIRNERDIREAGRKLAALSTLSTVDSQDRENTPHEAHGWRRMWAK